MDKYIDLHIKRFCAGMLTACFSSCALATEGGMSAYPNGIENFMTAAMPPPGLYGAVAVDFYHADRLAGNDGGKLNVPGFELNANVIANGIVWVSHTRFLGGDLLGRVIVPVVNVSASVAGSSQSKTGVGDVTTGLGVGYHLSPYLHSLLALEVALPTGGYRKTELVNIGQNHLSVLPLAGVTYVDPEGFNGDVKLGFIFNRRNGATGFKSGNEFHMDYAAGWGVAPGWTIGVGGYVYQQIGDDTGPGSSGNRTRARAIGPSLKYDGGKTWFATLKVEKEFNVRNRPQGNSIWLKAAFPL